MVKAILQEIESGVKTLELVDAINLEFKSLHAILGLCRVAALGDEDGELNGELADADLPDAIYAARDIARSIEAHVAQLSAAARGAK